MQRNNPQLINHQRILRTHLPRREYILLRQRHIRQPKVLHPDKKQREVRPGEVALGGRVGRDGLVVLAFVGERVGVGEPGGAETGVDQDGFAVKSGEGKGKRRGASVKRSTEGEESQDAPEESSRLLPPLPSKVPQPDSVPTNRVVRFVFDHFVGDEEEFGAEVGEMVHAGEMEREGGAVGGVEGEDAVRERGGVNESMRKRGGPETHCEVIL